MTDLTLLLTVGSTRHVVKLPTTATLQQLYDTATAVSTSEVTSQAPNDSPVVQQLTRAMPRLDLPNDPNITLQMIGLHSQDRILVHLAQSQTLSSPSSSATTAAMTNTTSTTTRVQRVAARKAREAIDDALETEATNKNNNNNNMPTKKISSRTKLGNHSRDTSSPGSGRKRIRMDGMGYRLNDGSPVGKPLPKQQSQQHSKEQKRSIVTNTSRSYSYNSSNASPRRRIANQHARRKDLQPSPALSMESDEIVLGAVLAATDGKNATGNAAKLMRAGWRRAVQDAEEQNKAVARLAAVRTGRYQITTTTTTANNNNATATGGENHANRDISLPTQLVIHFEKGVQGRGSYEDQVDDLPEQVLQSVIQAIHPVNTESLRPENLALLSPRVFWSIVRCVLTLGSSDATDRLTHPQSTTTTTTTLTTTATTTTLLTPTPIDFKVALQQLLPQLDWSFLRRRKQQLSAKALENLRQEKESIEGVNTHDWQAAAEAIEAVEVAMGQLETLERQSRQALAVLAAEKRMGLPKFVLTTPTEVDMDELSECIQGSMPPLELHTVEGIARTLVESCNVHNWRELSNARPETLHAILQHPLEDIHKWQEYAQLQTIDEIMVEICQGNVDAVQLLASRAQSQTPKDLAGWRGIADILHQQLREGSDDTPEISIPAPQELEVWCDRAHQALEQLEWLNWYATPLSD